MTRFATAEGVSSARRAAFVALAGVGVAVLLLSGAMASYPGGTWCDAGTVGHSFFRNFLCDLTSSVALGGAPNGRGAALGRAAMLSLVVAVVAFFRAAPGLFPAHVVTARLVRAFGLASMIGAAAVTLLPSQRFGDLHAIAVFAAGALGFIAAVLVALGLARAEPAPRVGAALGGLAIATSVADMAMYAVHFIEREDCAPLLPLVQKVALALVLAWVVVTALKVITSSGRTRS
jgi:hypothetical protein